MSNPTVPVTETTGVTPPTATAASNAGVTPEEVAQLRETIADLQKQVKFAVTKLTKQPTSTTITPPASESEPEEGTAKEEVRKLKEERKRDKEADAKKAARRADAGKKTALTKLLTEQGVLGEAQQRAMGSLLFDHGSKMAYDDETGEVTVKESEYEDAISLTTFVGKLTKGGWFKIFKPSPETNTSGPSNGPRGQGGSDLPKFKRTQDVPPDLMKTGKWELDVE